MLYTREERMSHNASVIDDASDKPKEKYRRRHGSNLRQQSTPNRVTFYALLSILYLPLPLDFHKCLNMLSRLIILFVIVKMSWAVEGVIWSKRDGKFVPLYSIPNFRSAKNDYLERVRDLEFHNFHHQSITLAFYQVSFVFLREHFSFPLIYTILMIYRK